MCIWQSSRLRFEFEPSRVSPVVVSPCLLGTCPRGRHGWMTILKIGRGDWRSFERSPAVLAPFLNVFLGPPEPDLLTVDCLARRTGTG